MREFADIGGFLRFMQGMPARMEIAGQRGLKEASALIAKEAKAEIGTYQDATGPFPAWEALHDATLYGFYHPLAGPIEGKIDAGYATEAEHRPLERTGALARSIETEVEPGGAVVGSNDDVMVYQEMGTPNALYPIAPRPVLGGAAFRKERDAVALMAGHPALTLAGVPDSGPRALLLGIVGKD